MAQEIVTWCDVHMTRDEVRVPGETMSVIINDGAKLKIDVCEPCKKELFGGLLDVMQSARPTRTGGPGSRGGTYPKYDCPLCKAAGEEHRATRSSLRDHFPTVHDTTLAQVESDIGETLDGHKLKYPCDFPGCGLKFSHAQGMGAHKRSVHGVLGDSTTAIRERATAEQERPVKTAKAPAKRK